MGQRFSIGNKTSKPNEEEAKEEAELKRIVNFISTSLQEHEDAVYNISHSVKTQTASIQVLSAKINRVVSVNEASEKPIDGLEQIICSHCTSEWQENANVLLRSVQSSLYLQSKALCSTFQRLNRCMCEINDRYKIIGGDTSVDNDDYDRYCLDYIDSPKTDYEKRCKELEAELKELKRSDLHLKSNNSRYAQQLKEMKQRNENLIAEREEQSVKMKDVKKCLETNVYDMEEKVKDHKEKLQDMEEKLEYQKGKLKDMEEKLKCKQEKIHDMEEKSKSQEEKIQEMHIEMKGLRVEKISLEKDMDDMKQAITVQLFHNLKGGMIPTLLNELKTMLATQMLMKRQEIQFVICQTERDVNPKIPVFVFCINASRLGTDASSAIQNLKVSSKVSILVFHHKDVHALPSQASERVLTEPEFKELGGIFDIAFLADKGIYACDMNHATSIGIESYLRKQS